MGVQQLLPGDLLDAQVEAQGERAFAAHQPLLLRPLDAGLALAVDVHEPGHVAGEAALRVDAMLGGAELDPGQAQLQDGALLLRRDPVLDPGEPARGLEPALQLRGIHAREDRGQPPGGVGLVEQLGRIGMDAGHAQVGGQHHAVAVDDVGTADLGHRRRRGGGSRVGRAPGLPADHVDQAQPDAQEGQGEDRPDHLQPGPALGEAGVDAAHGRIEGAHRHQSSPRSNSAAGV